MNLVDYITAGLNINVIFGIDFTASNKSPKKKQSLHYISDEFNQYEESIY